MAEMAFAAGVNLHPGITTLALRSALMRVSKDGHQAKACPRPSFETAAPRARPPQMRSEDLNVMFDMIGFMEMIN